MDSGVDTAGRKKHRERDVEGESTESGLRAETRIWDQDEARLVGMPCPPLSWRGFPGFLAVAPWFPFTSPTRTCREEVGEEDGVSQAWTMMV